MFRLGNGLAVVVFIALLTATAHAGDPCNGQPDGDPCDDGVGCTLNDQCTGGVCMGTYQVDLFADLVAPFGIVDWADITCAFDALAQPVLCPEADLVSMQSPCEGGNGVDMSDLAAVALAATGNPECDDTCPSIACNSDADCVDGLFCSGTEACVDGECRAGFDQCPGNACDEGTSSCVPTNTLMSCQLSGSEISPTGSVTLDVFLENAAAVRAYQSRIAITRTSGTGTLSVSCIDGAEGIFVDNTRSDWIYDTGAAGFGNANCGALRAGGGVLFTSDAVNVGSPKYLASYILEASADAQPGSTFEVALLPGPHSVILDPNSNQQPLALAPPCVITIVSDVEPPTVVAVGPRYIEVTPADSDTAVALLVTSDDEPCVALFVQAPVEINSRTIGRLGADPVLLSSAEWGTVYVSDEAILPLASYRVRPQPADATLFPSVTVTMWRWSDVDNSGGPVTFDDILCILDGFAGTFEGACSFFGSDIEAGLTNVMIDFDDVLASLNAFGGEQYLDNPAHSDPCP